MILPLVASLALASPAPAARLLAVEDETLPSGLRVLAHTCPDAPTLSVKLLLPTGAAADPPGRSGLAHLVEHLAFEGSAHAPGNAGDAWLRAAGGQSDAATRHDHVVFATSAPPEALPLALFLESERLGWLTPTAEALANQQAVVANERAGSARADQVREALAPLLWPASHPYSRPVIGRPDELARVTMSDVSAFVARALRPEGAILVMVGPRPAAEMVAEARRWFGEEPGARAATPWFPAPGTLDAGGSPREAPTTAGGPAAQGDRNTSIHSDVIRAWVPGDVDRVRLRLAWRTVDRSHPDRVALELAGAVLADTLQDLAVDVNAWSGRYGGELTLAADGDAPALALARIERAVDHLARVGPTEDTLARIRAMARAWELRGLQTADGRAAAILGCAERMGPPDCLPIEWAAREAVGPAAVREVVRRWLTPSARVLLAVAPASRRRAPLPRMTLRAPP